MNVRDRRDFFKTVAGAAAGMYVVARGGNAVAQAPARRQVSIGGQRVRVVDVHAHCEMPLGAVVTGTPFENRAERPTRLDDREALADLLIGKRLLCVAHFSSSSANFSACRSRTMGASSISR